MNFQLLDFLNKKQIKRIMKYNHIKSEDILSLEIGMKICLFNIKNFKFKYAGTLMNSDDTFLIIKNMKNYNIVIPFEEYIVFAKKCTKSEHLKCVLENLN